MAADRITNDRQYTGTVTFTTAPALPANTITAQTQIAAAIGIAYTKVQQLRREMIFQAGTAASASIPIMRGYGATGTVLAVNVGSIAIAVGAATVTVDIKKNGTTILSAVVQLDSGNTARVTEGGTITVPSYVAGDFFEAVIVATAGGGTIPTGLFVEMIASEDPA